MVVIRTGCERLVHALCFTVSLWAGMPVAIAADVPRPDVAVFVANLNVARGTIDHAVNIAPGKGTNFQPSFVNDSSAVLFASERSGTANIYKYVIASGETLPLTSTKENLYSPTALSDGSGFVAVRVVNPDPYYGLEATAPTLWRFGWDGKPLSPWVDMRRAAYYSAIGEQQVAMFIVDEVAERNAHKVVVLDRPSGKVTVISEKAGRSLAAAPDGKRIGFVDQRDPKRWVIAAIAPGEGAPTALVDTVAGPAGEKESQRSQYFVWLRDGSILMANGTRFYRWNGVKGSAFMPFADLGKIGGAIKNIALSPDGKKLAFSVSLDTIAPAP